MPIEKPTTSNGDEITINLQQQYLSSSKDPLVLELAVKAKDCKLIEHLLEIDYDVNITSNYCEPVLNCAVNCNNINLVQKLIPKVDVNTRTKDGTALTLAIASGYYDIANLLIAAGANVKDHKKSNYNLLNEGVEEGNYEMSKCLISLGYNVDNICSKTGETPLQTAARKNLKEIVKILVDNRADVNSCATFMQRILKNRNRLSPLHYGVINKNKEIVYILLKNGANISLKSEIGSVVDQARYYNFIEFLEILAEIKVKDNSSSDYDKELYWAVDECEFDLARKLINRIIVQLRGKWYIQKCMQIFQYLLRSGINADILCENKPLIHTVCEKYEETLKYLMDQIPNIYNVFCNTTFLLIAIGQNHIELAKYYIEKYNEMNEAWCDMKPLTVAILNNRNEIAEYLIDKGADLNIGWRDVTPLHLAILFGATKIAEYLIGKGANLKAVWYGTTLLHLAIFHGRNQIAKYLIDNNADLNVICEGVSSLRLAICKKNDEIAEYLIENGANLDETCEEEISPLLGAELQRCKVVKYLIRKNSNLHQFFKHTLEVSEPSVYNDMFYTIVNVGYSCYSYVTSNNVPKIINKSTLLHIALKCDNENIISYLLNAGFDVNKEDRLGKVAINYTNYYIDRYHRLDGIELIEEHIIKLLAADFYVCEKNKIIKDYDLLYNECLEEVERMKDISLTPTLTYYDLLHKSLNESTRKLKFLFKDCQSNEISIDSCDIQAVFPLYHGIINFRLKRALQRVKLMVKLNRFILHISCELNLEPNLVRDIFEYFSNVELKVAYNNL